MRAIAVIVLVGILSLPMDTQAQQLKDWTDIDCAKSKILLPEGHGLRCRTVEYAPQDQGTSGGAFTRFNAYSRADSGKTTFYLLTEATIGGYVYSSGMLQVLKTFPAGKDAHSISEPLARDGINYLRFTARTGENCVAARKLGPGHSMGYRWILIASHCGQSAVTLAPQQEQAFMDTMRVR